MSDLSRHEPVILDPNAPSSRIAGAARRATARDRFGAWSEVPWRTIVSTIGLVVAAMALLEAVRLAQRVILLIVIAGFFAVVLAPPVRMFQARLHLRRGLAITLVVLLTLGSVLGLIAVFVFAVREQVTSVLTDLPGTVRQAAMGRGPVGNLVQRLDLEELVDRNRDSLIRAAESLQESMPDLVGRALALLLQIITVVVMTSLMLSQSKALSRTALSIVPERRREEVAAVSRQAASAISGYMIGNLVISLCAGVSALLVLVILGVPNAIVIALWVAFADLIPLVGATLGAIVAVLAAVLVSPGAGVAALIFFLLYQQFENSVLQVMVMSRTVRVNPLVVLLSVLLGVEMFGFVGALLAIPVAGALTVVFKEIWRHRATAADQLVLVSERGAVLLGDDLVGTETSSDDLTRKAPDASR